MQWHSITSKTIYQTIIMVRDTMVDDMSASTTIDAQAMTEEVDSPGIKTTDCVDPSSASHVIKMDINTKIVHIRIEQISNSILTVG